MTVGAIEGRAEYRNAQATVDSEVSDIKTSCKESEKKQDFFEVSIFFDYGLLPAARACAPVIWSLHGCFDFQMDLVTKFKMVTACQHIKITSLKIDMPYPIERAEKVQTKYGKAILMTLRAESSQTFVKVFLPRRYGTLSSDDDLCSNNKKTISLSLKYLGTNTTSNSYILELV